jgi:hypothetical protein
MKKFLLLYTAPTETREKMQSASSEEMKEGMEHGLRGFKKLVTSLLIKEY